MKKGILAVSCFGLLLAIRLPMSAADAKKGESVFENCAVCHNADSTEVKIGPGLKGLFKREKLVTGKPVNTQLPPPFCQTQAHRPPWLCPR